MKNISIEKTEVRSSLEVWDFMQDRQSDRHSKLQAYCSLLNKAAVRYVPNSVPKGSIPKLKEYQFVTTISELAEEWHWHRATVRSFLDKLTTLGQLDKEPLVKSFVISMHCMTNGKPSNLEVVHHLDFMIDYTISLWSSGKANNHDVAKMCVHITACGIEHFKSTVPDCNADMLRNAEDEIIRTFICSLTASLFHASKQMVEYTVLCDLLYSFFVEQLSQKWEALLLLLEELPLVVLKGVPTTLKLVSEESSKSFQQICSTYRQLSDGGLSRSNGSDAAEQHSGI